MGLTTTDGKILTTRDAEADQQSFRKEVNGRQVLPDPDWLQEMRAKKIHVINVGPWGADPWCGSFGQFHCLPCWPDAEGKWGPRVKEAHGIHYTEFEEYDAKQGKWVPSISSMMFENIIDNEVAMRLDRGQKGEQFAWEMLGEGRGQNMAFSLRHRGFTVIAGSVPTQDELLSCQLELEEECRRLVSEARELQASNEPFARQAIIKGRHDIAAQILNLTDEPWLIAKDPQARQKCPICGSYSDPGVMKCGSCKEYIFDREGYAKLLAEQETAVRPKGSK